MQGSEEELHVSKKERDIGEWGAGSELGLSKLSSCRNPDMPSPNPAVSSLFCPHSTFLFEAPCGSAA